MGNSCMSSSPPAAADFLATVAYDGGSNYWDTRRKVQFAKMNAHGRALSIAVSPDGRVALCGDKSGDISIWAAPSGQLLTKLEFGDFETVYSVAWLRGDLLIVGGDRKLTGDPDANIDNLHVVDVASRHTIAKLRGHYSDILTIAVCSRGGDSCSCWFATGGADNRMRVWDAVDLARYEPVADHKHNDWVRSVAVVDETRVASACDDRFVRIWGIGEYGGKQKAKDKGNKKLTELHKLELGFPCVAVAVSPTCATIAAGCLHGGVSLWTASADGKHEERRLKGHGGSHVRTIQFAYDGKTLASGAEDDAVRLWDVASGEEVAVLKHSANVRALRFAPPAVVVHHHHQQQQQQQQQQPLNVNTATAADMRRLDAAAFQAQVRSWECVGDKVLGALYLADCDGSMFVDKNFDDALFSSAVMLEHGLSEKDLVGLRALHARVTGGGGNDPVEQTGFRRGE